MGTCNMYMYMSMYMSMYMCMCSPGMYSCGATSRVAVRPCGFPFLSAVAALCSASSRAEAMLLSVII